MEGEDITYNEQGLYDAAGRGDVEYVKKALANKIDPNWQNPDWRKYTALHQASRYNQPAVVRALVAAGANINLKEEWSETALYLASESDSVDAVTALLDCGADIEIAAWRGKTPVMSRCSVEVMKLLIDAHANLKQIDNYGQTPLHYAIEYNNSEKVQLLLQKGIDPREQQDKKGMTPVDFAKKLGYHKLVTIMVGDDVEITELDLFNAAGRGDVEYVDKALANKIDPNWQNPDESRRTALHQASMDNNPAIIRKLLAAGANKDLKDKSGCTPIYMASDYNVKDAVTTLLDCGADIEIASDGGCTPVMITHQVEIVEVLIDAHANLRQADRYGRTALHLIVCNNQLEIAKLLLQKGIDAMQKEEDGMTAAEYARKFDKHELADIIDSFTGITSTAPGPTELEFFYAAYRGDIDFVEKALTTNIDPNWQNPDDYHMTALHQASKYDNPAVIKMLLAAGAKKDLKDDSGETPIFKASDSDRIDAINILIDCGADINIANDGGKTPLMAVGSVEVAEVLIDAHANLRQTDDLGWTALHHAVYWGNPEICLLLLKKGIDAMKQNKEGLTAAECARNCNMKYKEQELADIIDSFTGTPYHLPIITELEFFDAASSGDVVCVDKALANKIDPNWVNPDDRTRTALHPASLSNHSAVIRLLVAAGANTDLQDEDGDTAIYLASNYSKIDAVTTLIDCGADINITSYGRGMTPVMIATYKDNLEVVEALIVAHANLRKTDDFGRTALHYAVWSNRVEQVQLILQKGIHEGIDARKQDNDGLTAADYARNSDEPEIADIIESFIASTASTGEPSTTAPLTTATSSTTIVNNELDLFYAAERGDVEYVNKALGNKTDPNWQNPDWNQSTALHRASRFNHSVIIRKLVAAGANTELQDEDGETPIYLASKIGQMEAVTTLIDCGADINITNPGGKTPIMVAWSMKVVDALIDAHANLRQADNIGRTALHWAVWMDQSEKVPLLLRKGIDTMKQDITGQTAADYARNCQHHELLELIDSFTTSNASTDQQSTTVPTTTPTSTDQPSTTAPSTTTVSTASTDQPSTTTPSTTAISTASTDQPSTTAPSSADVSTAPIEKPIPESPPPDYNMLLYLLTSGIVLYIAIILYNRSE